MRTRWGNREIALLLDVYLTAGLDKGAFKAKNDALNDRKAAAQAEADAILREREAKDQKRATEQSLEQRVGAVLDELVLGEPTLERKRQVLGDLLSGGRVIAGWPKKKPADRGRPWASITLPAFGALPPATVRTDQGPYRMLGGAVARVDRDAWKQHGGRIKDGDVSLMLRPAKGSRYVLGLQTPAGVLSGGGEGFIPLVAAEEPPPRRPATSWSSGAPTP